MYTYIHIEREREDLCTHGYIEGCHVVRIRVEEGCRSRMQAAIRPSSTGQGQMDQQQTREHGQRARLIDDSIERVSKGGRVQEEERGPKRVDPNASFGGGRQKKSRLLSETASQPSPTSSPQVGPGIGEATRGTKWVEGSRICCSHMDGSAGATRISGKRMLVQCGGNPRCCE